MLGYYNSKDHPRDSSANAIKVELKAVRPDPDTPLEENRYAFFLLFYCVILTFLCLRIRILVNFELRYFCYVNLFPLNRFWCYITTYMDFLFMVYEPFISFNSLTASSQVTCCFTPYTVASSSKSTGFSHQLFWS